MFNMVLFWRVCPPCKLDGVAAVSLHWRHNGHDTVSNHQPHDCLLNRLFRHRSKTIQKLGVTGLCARNSPVTGKFPAQMTSNAENVSIDDVIMFTFVWHMCNNSPLSSTRLRRERRSQERQAAVQRGEEVPDDILSYLIHDDVIKWKHFPRYWPFVRGIHRSPVNSQHKGQWRGLWYFLWSASE